MLLGSWIWLGSECNWLGLFCSHASRKHDMEGKKGKLPGNSGGFGYIQVIPGQSDVLHVTA